MNEQKRYKIYALIPARSGSKRVSHKNLRDVGPWSLLRWAIEIAKLCASIEKVVVSTDSRQYAQVALKCGAEVLMRDYQESSDIATDLDVIKHFLQHFPCDYVVYLRPTTPFRTAPMIEMAIQTMIQAGENATSLRSVDEMGESAWKTFELEHGYLHPICGSMQVANAPNQSVVKTYRGNGYVDILKGPEWGDRCIGYLTPPVIEIDTERDLQYANWVYAHKNLREEVVFR